MPFLEFSQAVGVVGEEEVLDGVRLLAAAAIFGWFGPAGGTGVVGESHGPSIGEGEEL